MTNKSPKKRQLPGLAIIANSLPPYRLYLHQRIALEMCTEIVMHTVCTHEVDYRHPYAPTPLVNATSFGPGQAFTRQLRLQYVPSEWLKAGRIIRWLKRNHIKAVLLLGYNDIGRVRILYWCHRSGLPCLLFGDSNIRGDRTTGLKAAMKQIIVGQFVRWARAFMVCGRLGRQYWAKYGAPLNRTFDFPYEPDYNLITNLSVERIEEVRQRFRLAANRRRIVFSGRFVATKRPQLLVDAFVAIAGCRPQWDLVMVGDEPPAFLKRGQAPLRDRVPERLKPRVLFTGFLQHQWMVSAVYRASDVLCLPSDYEPWALVVNEAAAAGMAIVASEVVGAAAELVRDGINGRLFSPHDKHGLAEALLDVTAPERIDAMRSASLSVLNDWRRRGDPIDGLRQALRLVNVIS